MAMPPQGGPPVFYKNPAVSAVLSFLYAGLGQIYNGEIGKAIGFIIGYTFAWLLCFIVIGFFILPFIWIAGMVDAYSSANRINQRLWQQSQPPQYRPPGQ